MTLMSITIRPEVRSDYSQITDVIDQAFAGKPYAGGDESDLVIKLRELDVLTLGLVAEFGGTFAGYIAFSPAAAEDGTEGWFALGPVAVYPQFQSVGIGGKLINEGLKQIKKLGAIGCMLTGNPDYYLRFGFGFSANNVPTTESAAYFMMKRLNQAPLPLGPMAFHPAFYGASDD